MKTQKRNLNYYMVLPYAIRIVYDQSGTYFGEIEELPGCMTQADTPEEVLSNIVSAKRGWLKAALKNNIEIPIPEEMKEHSGKLLLRMPKFLHRRIAMLAHSEGTSINQMIVALLSERATISALGEKIRAKYEILALKAEDAYSISKKVEKIVLSNTEMLYHYHMAKGKISGTWENTTVKT